MTVGTIMAEIVRYLSFGQEPTSVPSGTAHHVDEDWTWRCDGSDTEMTFRLARAKKLLALAHTAE
jgi:hypothetical protein